MKARRWLLLLVIALFIWFVAARANEVEHLVETLASGDLRWIFVAGLLHLTYFVTQSRIFQLCFNLVGVRSKLVELVPVYLSSMFINAVAPSGGTAGLAIYVDDAVQRGESGARATAGTLLGVVAEYSGFGVLLLFGLAYLSVQASVRVYEIIAAVALLLFTLLLTSLIVLGATRPQQLFAALGAFQAVINGLARRLRRQPFLQENWSEEIGAEFAAAAGAGREDPRGLLVVLAWSVFSYLVNAASLYAIFVAFGQIASPFVVFTAFTIGHLFVIIAPSPQGVGFVETILPLTLIGFGIPSAVATIVVLAYRGLAFWMPMLLGFFMLQRLRSLGGKERALRELWNVRIVAILTALMGFVNVVSVTYPALAHDLRPVTQFAPLQLRRGGQVGALLTGLILFLLAGALWRRKRTAWFITVIVLLLSAVSLVLENSLFDIRSLLTLALAIWLVRQRAHFHARSDPPSVREGAVVISGALAFLVLYGGAGIYVLALRSGEVHDLQTIAAATVSTIFALRPPAWLPALEAGRFLLTSVYAAGVLTFLYAFFQLVRPVLLPRPAMAAERERASVLVTAYGRNATSRLALLPDVSYYFSRGGSVVAFILVGRTAMALGDPIGPGGDAEETIKGFAFHCRRNDWLPAFYFATETYVEHYEEAGFDVMAVGREAIVDVNDFEQNGDSIESPTAAEVALQHGHRAGVSMPPHPPELLEELRLINDEWMTVVRGESDALLLSHFDRTQVAQSPIIMTQTPRSLVSAYATLIMDPGGESLAIDVWRHRPQVREGTLELLVIALIRWAQRHKFRNVNLGTGFPGLIGDGAAGGGSRDLLSENGEPPTVARLHAVRSRFNPRWAPRYLVYPGATSLPAVWNAVARQRWGGHWLWLLATRRLGL